MTVQNSSQELAQEIRDREGQIAHIETEIAQRESAPDLMGVKDQIHELRQDEELKTLKGAVQQRESDLGIPVLNSQKKSIEQHRRLPELKKAKREEEGKLRRLQRRLVDINL